MTLHQVAGAPNDTTRAGADPSNNFVEDKDTLKDFKEGSLYQRH